MASLRALKFIGTYTLLGFLPLAINFLLLPLYTARLVPAEYGIVAVAGVAQTFATLAISVGLDAAFARLYFDHLHDLQARLRLFGTVLVATLVTTLVLLSILLSAGRPIFRHVFPEIASLRYAAWILLSAIGGVLYSLCFAWHRNGERLRSVLFLALGTTGGSTLGSVLGLWLFPNAIGALAGRSLGFALGLLPMLFFTVRDVPFAIDRAQLRAVVAYGLPLVPYTLIAYLLFNGDRIVMQRWFPLTTVGLYALAATLASPVEIAVQAAQNAAQPMFYRQLDDKSPTITLKMETFYLIMILLGIVCMVGLDAVAIPVLRLMKGARYDGAKGFLLLLAYTQLLRTRYAGTAFCLFYAKRTKPLPLITVGAIVAGFLAAAVSVKVVGPLGVAVGVLAWKFTHERLALLVLSSTPGVRLDLSKTTPWIVVSGIYVCAVYGVRSRAIPHAEIYILIAGIALSAAAVWQSLLCARTAGFLGTPVAPAPPPDEAGAPR